MEILNISREAFQKYGVIFSFPDGCKDAFHVVDQDEEAPWRTALFRFRNKEVTVLERHPNTKETFEPLQGTALLLTAETDSPERFQCFLLDRAVSLKKGIWHQVLSLSEETVVKITENYQVETEFFHLNGEWRAGLDSGRKGTQMCPHI